MTDVSWVRIPITAPSFVYVSTRIPPEGLVDQDTVLRTVACGSAVMHQSVTWTLLAVDKFSYGEVGEWPIPSDCKSDLNRAMVRIHPSPPYVSYYDRIVQRACNEQEREGSE
jgi:hypothetical protein